MSSRLVRPLTDSNGDFIDYGNGNQGNASQPEHNGAPRGSYEYYTGRQDSGVSGNNEAGPRSSFDYRADKPYEMPKPEQYVPHEDGGMQNLMAPPDDRNVYPQAAPVGPAAGLNLGRHAQTVECPWCHSVVTTQIKRRIGYKSGGAAVVVALLVWPLFWVPLVVPGLHRKVHYCPQCNRKIGRGRRNV
ncbi:hypothetical protein GGH97_003103 [Coemansia sp. RSA 475]|nr:hypothetical protein GGH97_003103 [Coemansia sp. RSA 475]